MIGRSLALALALSALPLAAQEAAQDDAAQEAAQDDAAQEAAQDDAAREAAGTDAAREAAGNGTAREATAADPGGPPPETSRRPRERPAGLAGDRTDAGAGDGDVTVVDAGPPVPDRLAAGPEELASCLAALDSLGVSYDRAEPIAAEDDADCGIRKPLRVTGLPGGVALEPAGHLRCETARALAEWTAAHAIPAAGRLPGRGALGAIEQGGTYVCRRRGGRPEGELSEHAFGNAVDVTGFRFAEGAPIPVQPREREGTMAEAFQDAVRATACLHFTTVLGPGTDAAHADHLHLDVVDRRGDFRLCQ